MLNPAYELDSRSRKAKMTWENFAKIKELFPLLLPRIIIPYGKLKSLEVL